jgi:hypothetical protein
MLGSSTRYMSPLDAITTSVAVARAFAFRFAFVTAAAGSVATFSA